MKLHKHTMTIWSPHGGDQELSTLAREAESGDSYCSDYQVTEVEDPQADPAFNEGAAEFFRIDEDDDTEVIVISDSTVRKVTGE